MKKRKKRKYIDEEERDRTISEEFRREHEEQSKLALEESAEKDPTSRRRVFDVIRKVFDYPDDQPADLQLRLPVEEAEISEHEEIRRLFVDADEEKKESPPSDPHSSHEHSHHEHRPQVLCGICRRKAGPGTTPLWRTCVCTEVLVHKECLERKLQAEMSGRCQACGHEYRAQWDHRHSILGGLWLWTRTTVSRTQLVLAVLTAALLTSEVIVVRGTVVAGTRRWLPPLAMFVLLGQAALMAHLVVEGAFLFFRWRREQATFKLLGQPGDSP